MLHLINLFYNEHFSSEIKKYIGIPGAMETTNFITIDGNI